MANELQCTAGVSARLDLLLSQYLQARRVDPQPIACPPWQDYRRRPAAQDQASFHTMDDTRLLSREELVHSQGRRHFD